MDKLCLYRYAILEGVHLTVLSAGSVLRYYSWYDSRDHKWYTELILDQLHTRFAAILSLQPWNYFINLNYIKRWE